MIYVLAIVLSSVLFAVFGLMRRKSRVGGGCSTCTTDCRAKDPTGTESGDLSTRTEEPGHGRA